jgi:hypothetical protein
MESNLSRRWPSVDQVDSQAFTQGREERQGGTRVRRLMFGAGSTSTSRNPNFDSVLETFTIFCEIPSVKRRTTSWVYPPVGARHAKFWARKLFTIVGDVCDMLARK